MPSNSIRKTNDFAEFKVHLIHRSLLHNIIDFMRGMNWIGGRAIGIPIMERRNQYIFFYH